MKKILRKYFKEFGKVFDLNQDIDFLPFFIMVISLNSAVVFFYVSFMSFVKWEISLDQIRLLILTIFVGGMSFYTSIYYKVIINKNKVVECYNKSLQSENSQIGLLVSSFFILNLILMFSLISGMFVKWEINYELLRMTLITFINLFVSYYLCQTFLEDNDDEK